MDDKCSGCRDNFYNGNNPFEIKECWSKKGAKVVSKLSIGVWELPPYKNKKPVKILSCYHKDGTIYVEPETITEEGFWR